MYTTTQTYRSSSVGTRSAVSELPTQYTPLGLTMPMRPGTRGVRAMGHETDHGFCSVCGAVWPCARARRDELAAEQAGSARRGY